MTNTRHAILVRLGASLLLLATSQSHAVEWSDTFIGYRWGTQFREPANTQDIKKNIFSLTHADGYKYGSNFFTVDMLQSDSKDPASGAFQGAEPGGAQEVFVVYRHTLMQARCSASTSARRTTISVPACAARSPACR
jgi:hypothetical protein